MTVHRDGRQAIRLIMAPARVASGRAWKRSTGRLAGSTVQPGDS
jgi:hypothetical protein